MNSDRQKPAVSLEDLLRLKRAERPPAAFWSQFDRDLRAKQLAAIIEPRPWWAPLIRLGARFSHYQLPVGATAILTLSILTVREYRTTDPVSPYAPEVAVQSATPAEQSVREVVAIGQPAAIAVVPPAIIAEEHSPINSVSPVPPQETAPQTRQPAASFAMFADMSARDRDTTPSARYIAANLAAAQEADPALAEKLVHPTRAVTTRQQLREPLAQVVSPSDARLARLLAPGFATVASVSESALRNTDRVARHLTEDRLYDSMSRINARGAGVLVKF